MGVLLAAVQIVGSQCKSTIELLARGFFVVRSQQHRQLQVRTRLVWVQLQGRFERGQRQLLIALFDIDRSEYRPRPGVLRVERDCLFEQLLRLDDLVLRDIVPCHQKMRVRRVRVRGEVLLQLRVCLRRLPRPEHRFGPLVAHLRVVGLQSYGTLGKRQRIVELPLRIEFTAEVIQKNGIVRVLFLQAQLLRQHSMPRSAAP